MEGKRMLPRVIGGPGAEGIDGEPGAWDLGGHRIRRLAGEMVEPLSLMQRWSRSVVLRFPARTGTSAVASRARPSLGPMW